MTTRFVFITDTHIGAVNPEFYQQTPYPDKLNELLVEIEQLTQSGSIDFVLHGGDMVHSCCPEAIQEAKRLFKFSVPVYLSLGNHDLDYENAMPVWMEMAPEFFNGASPQYSIVYGSCVIHIVPNQWEPESPYHWKDELNPFFLEEQLDNLKAEILKYPDKLHLLCIHHPIFGIPTEQSGFEQIIHDVPQHFRDSILKLMRAYPQVKVVLSGHNHVNTLTRTEEGLFISGSSFTESPFEYKIVEVTANSVEITTMAVKTPLSFNPKYDLEKSFAQGRACDRTVIMGVGK